MWSDTGRSSGLPPAHRYRLVLWSHTSTVVEGWSSSPLYFKPIHDYYAGLAVHKIRICKCLAIIMSEQTTLWLAVGHIHFSGPQTNQSAKTMNLLIMKSCTRKRVSIKIIHSHKKVSQSASKSSSS